MSVKNSLNFQNGVISSDYDSNKLVAYLKEDSESAKYYNRLFAPDNPIRLEKLVACYINGEWVKGKETFPVFDPATGNVIAYVPNMSVEDTKKCIESANDAFPCYSSTNVKERHDLLMRWRDLIVKYNEEIAQVLTLENGKTHAEASGEATFTAQMFEWYAEQIRAIDGSIIPNRPNKRFFTYREPIGPCSLIIPWNVPAQMFARKVGAALATGCTAVLKLAAETPLSGLALTLLGEIAGLPKGALNVITCSNDSVKPIGEELCTNTKIKKISFTGSCPVGKLLLKHSSLNNIKHISLELGGNAPFIVFQDADLQKATEQLIFCKYRNTGQTCISANRIFIHNSIFNQFANILIQKTQKFIIGPGYISNVKLGPLTSPKSIEKCNDLLNDAILNGAKILYDSSKSGNNNFNEKGYFCSLIILDCRNLNLEKLKIFKNEIFGPITPLYSFETEEEVIQLANSVNEGLSAYFCTNDINKFIKIPEKLNFGMVGINDGFISYPEIPFGGIKESGIGREGSRIGLEEFMNIKYVCLGC